MPDTEKKLSELDLKTNAKDALKEFGDVEVYAQQSESYPNNYIFGGTITIASDFNENEVAGAVVTSLRTIFGEDLLDIKASKDNEQKNILNFVGLYEHTKEVK